MAKRWDVMSARLRKGQDKPYWHKVGAAFEGEKGISISFDSLPLPDSEGSVRVSLFEPRERDGSQGAPQRTQQRQREEPLDDDVPF